MIRRKRLGLSRYDGETLKKRSDRKHGKIDQGKGAKSRLHIQSKFIGESFVSKILLHKTEASEYFRMHPEIDAIKIGGQSIIDRDIDSNLPTALQKSVCGRRK